MKRILFLAMFGLLLTPVFAVAQSALNGTWKVDMNKVDFPKKPTEYSLQNGMYQCKTCVPPVEVKADGRTSRFPAIPTTTALPLRSSATAKSTRRTRKTARW